MVTSIVEKGGAAFEGITLLLCENPLAPLEQAVEAAARELPRSNHYTEPYSAPLRDAIAEQLGVPGRLIHINAGSELILRQLFERFGERAHLVTPTYALFPEIAGNYTETRLAPESDFHFDLSSLEPPEGTTLVVIVNPNNPNGGVCDLSRLPDLLQRNRSMRVLVDEAFIDLAGESVASLAPEHSNLIVTRTFSKAHSLAGFRIGYAVASEDVIDELNGANDAYPLARPSQAAALATLEHMHEIEQRCAQLKEWTRSLAEGVAALGARIYPSETYFFLADFSPVDAQELARALAERGILVKPLNDPVLGQGFVRLTTSTPENNEIVIDELASLLAAPH